MSTIIAAGKVGPAFGGARLVVKDTQECCDECDTVDLGFFSRVPSNMDERVPGELMHEALHDVFSAAKNER